MKIAISLIALLIITDIIWAQPANSPWPVYHHDARHTGRSQYVGPQDSLIAWTFQTGGAIRGEASIGPDGTIFFGSMDGKLYAVNPDGTLKWAKDFGSEITSTPAIDINGYIYISADSVYCLNFTGVVMWSYHPGTYYFKPYSAVIMQDGGIVFNATINTGTYVFYQQGRVIVLNQDGTLRWQSRNNGFKLVPALGINDTIYSIGEGVRPCWGCPPAGGGLDKISPTGDSIWYYSYQNISVGPVLDEENNTYLGSSWWSGTTYGGEYKVIDRNRVLKNTITSITQHSGSERSSALFNEWIYYMNYKTLVCRNPLNNILGWTYNFNLSNYEYGTSPIVDAERNVYLGTTTGILYCIDSSGTLKWNKNLGISIGVSGSIGSIGTLYIGAEDGKLYAFGETTVNSITWPKLFISSASIPLGSSININGNKFSENSPIQLRFIGPPGFEQISVPLVSNDSGEIFYIFPTTQNFPTGLYSVYAIDELSNRSTQTCHFEVTEALPAYEITILRPPPTNNFYSGQVLRVQWIDKMEPRSSYPIVGAQRAYNYNIEISSDGGNVWNPFGIKSGYEPVGTVQQFEFTAILAGNGANYVVRITDYFYTTRNVISEQFTVLPMISTNLKVDLIWDYSFPIYRTGYPTGVAADGIARTYLKLSKIEPNIGNQINSVSITLSDGVSNEPRLLGKVMVATVIDTYSDEANSASQTQILDDISREEYWFWYVAPDDFVRDESYDGRKSYREVTATFTVNYEGGIQEIVKENIMIVRPPLMLVHGIGGSANTWKNFAWKTEFYRVLFKDDPRFQVRNIVTLETNKSFDILSQRLLSSDINSLPRTTLEMKQKGYASNQVYYIGHSMGGNLVRTAAQLYPSLFYKNYQKGYVNRFISLDTPHLGSPLADLLEDWMQALNNNLKARYLLTLMLGYTPNFLGFNFIQPEDYSKLIYEFELTGSANDLRINNRFQHQQTNIPSHLVVCDFFPGEQNIPGVNPIIWEALEIADKYINFLDIFFDVVYNSSTINPTLKSQLKPLRKLNKAERVVKFINYTLQLYSSLGFILESDFVVGVTSQLAGLPRGGNSQTIFDAQTHTTWLPYAVISSDAVGSKVYELLNASIYHSYFAPIPSSSTNLKKTPKIKFNPNHSHSLALRSDGISIITPTYGTEVYVDSTISINFFIADTTNLSYIKLNFQNHSIVDTTKYHFFNFDLQVDGSMIDSQLVQVTAIKEYTDSTIIITTSEMVYVKTNTPLIRFTAEPQLQKLIMNQNASPEYRAEFSTFLSSIANNSSGLQATVNNSAVIEFDPSQKFFRAIGNGETSAIINYGGLSDTIYFIVEGEESIPHTPILEAPENQANILPGEITFIWNGSFNATEYHIQISSTIDFSSAIVDQEGVVDTNYQQLSLPMGITYFWRIRATNYIGNSDWSAIWSFTVEDTTIQTTFQVVVSVQDGWNMVSIPGLHPTDQNVNTWWAYRDPSANVFKYAGGYLQVTEAIPGIGNWMKHSGARTYNTGEEWPVTGLQIVPHNPISAAAGWNLIGGYELIASTSGIITNPPGLWTGPVYKYAGGYYTATSLEPGYGYWIKLSAAGQIIIPETLAKEGKSVEFFSENWGKITLTDATGISYTLYAVKGEVDLSQYDLPPAPPTGMFDIRFSSGRIAEDINSSIKSIDMSGVTYPLTVRVEGMDIRLMDETGKNVNVNLKSGEDVVISDATIQKLMVSGELIPAAYSLEQNYPNPFNPSTVIEFSLPEDVSNVKLSIYNSLGEKVAELINTSLQAGRYQYQWNAIGVATGMYIYELRTDKFVSIKKMILLK